MLSLPSSPQVKADFIVLLEIPVLWKKWSVLVLWYFAELAAVELLLRQLKEFGKILQNSLAPSLWNVAGRDNEV
jgi:hypothetical protein